MQNKKLKVLVFGGTGSQARPVVEHLLANHHEPYVLTRNPQKAADLASKGAKIVVGDLEDKESIRQAMEGKDSVAFMIPAFLKNSAEGKTYGLNAIDCAKEAGVKLLVWNLSGSVREESTGDYRNALIRHLKEIQLPHILFEPTTYMENWLGPWTANYIKEKNLVSYPQLAVKRVGWIASEDLGKLITAALERPELSGQHFKVSGIESPSGTELAKIFSEALSRPLTYYPMPPDEMGSVLEKAFGPGAGRDVVEMYRKEQADPLQPGKYYDMKPVLEKLPAKMTTIKEWVQKHSSFFQDI